MTLGSDCFWSSYFFLILLFHILWEHNQLIIMSGARCNIVFEARKLHSYCLFEGCGQTKQWFYKPSLNAQHFLRNSFFYQWAVPYFTRRPGHLGEQIFFWKTYMLLSGSWKLCGWDPLGFVLRQISSRFSATCSFGFVRGSTISSRYYWFHWWHSYAIEIHDNAFCSLYCLERWSITPR